MGHSTELPESTSSRPPFRVLPHLHSPSPCALAVECSNKAQYTRTPRKLSNWRFPAPPLRLLHIILVFVLFPFCHSPSVVVLVVEPLGVCEFIQSGCPDQRRKYRDGSCSIVKSNLRIFRVDGQFLFLLLIPLSPSTNSLDPRARPLVGNSSATRKVLIANSEL